MDDVRYATTLCEAVTSAIGSADPAAVADCAAQAEVYPKADEAARALADLIAAG